LNSTEYLNETLCAIFIIIIIIIKYILA